MKKLKRLALLLCWAPMLSSCTLISTHQKKLYPAPPYKNKNFILNVQFENHNENYLIGFKNRKIDFTEDTYLPAVWDFPDKKTPCAVPVFSTPIRVGLALGVHLKYNKFDNTLSLAGKYYYRIYRNPRNKQRNLYISDPKLDTYSNILNIEDTTRQSSFYLIKFVLNKKYEIILSDDNGIRKSVFLTITLPTEKEKKKLVPMDIRI